MIFASDDIYRYHGMIFSQAMVTIHWDAVCKRSDHDTMGKEGSILYATCDVCERSCFVLDQALGVFLCVYIYRVYVCKSLGGAEPSGHGSTPSRRVRQALVR